MQLKHHFLIILMITIILSCKKENIDIENNKDFCKLSELEKFSQLESSINNYIGINKINLEGLEKIIKEKNCVRQSNPIIAIATASGPYIYAVELEGKRSLVKKYFLIYTPFNEPLRVSIRDSINIMTGQL